MGVASPEKRRPALSHSVPPSIPRPDDIPAETLDPFTDYDFLQPGFGSTWDEEHNLGHKRARTASVRNMFVTNGKL